MTSTHVVSELKLGKLPVRTDVRTLLLARYVDRSVLPEPPPSLDLAAAVRRWPMYANDRLGDCTCAAAGHMVEAWTAAARGAAVEILEREVVEAFEAVKLVDPLTGAEGAIELDVLTLLARRGHRRPPDRRLRAPRRRRPRPREDRGVPVRRSLYRPRAAAERAVADRLGLERPPRRARSPRLVGRPRGRRRRVRRGWAHRRHLGRAEGDDLGVLGPVLRRGVLHHQRGLPARRP